jgi:tRNA (guanine-N7-)-methyltransferase
VETVRADNHAHPEDFVISRRRKQFRFNQFDEFANCFQFQQWLKARDDLLGGGGSLVVEIAAGSALFSVEIARCNPDKIFVAVDIKSDRLYRGARRANELKLANIFFVRSDITKITEVIPPSRAGEIWLTFPDPHPPERDAKHRLTSARFLKLYQEILRPDGAINFKTDSKTLFEWSLNSFRESGFETEFRSRDLHGEKNSRIREIPGEILREARVMTTYEEKFTREGRPIYFARFSKI